MRLALSIIFDMRFVAFLRTLCDVNMLMPVRFFDDMAIWTQGYSRVARA
jgi:hypothetical protein